MERVYNFSTKKHLNVNGAQYNKYISQNYYVKDGVLYPPNETPETETKVKLTMKQKTIENSVININNINDSILPMELYQEIITHLKTYEQIPFCSSSKKLVCENVVVLQNNMKFSQFSKTWSGEIIYIKNKKLYKYGRKTPIKTTGTPLMVIPYSANVITYLLLTTKGLYYNGVSIPLPPGEIINIDILNIGVGNHIMIHTTNGLYKYSANYNENNKFVISDFIMLMGHVAIVKNGIWINNKIYDVDTPYGGNNDILSVHHVDGYHEYTVVLTTKGVFARGKFVLKNNNTFTKINTNDIDDKIVKVWIDSEYIYLLTMNGDFYRNYYGSNKKIVNNVDTMYGANILSKDGDYYHVNNKGEISKII